MSLSLLKRLLVIGILVGGLAVAGYAWHLHKSFNQPFSQLDEYPEYIDVNPGDGLYKVCWRMKSLGLIESVRPFCRVAMWAGYNRLIKGRYVISEQDSAVLLLEKMMSGDVAQFNISLIEGQSFDQMMTRIAQNPNITSTLIGLSDAEIMVRVTGEALHPEGRFYPDTYTFSHGVSDLDVLIRAHKRLKKVLSEEWALKSKSLPYKNEYEALIMASIVEKETAVGSERPQIAKVFVRRLGLGMRLQTDPTVIYGMGDGYKGNITRRDLRKKTPYNTYQINGLPPTPIAMVGREAIHAALNPEGNNALYFVAKGDGTHHFSKTLSEHNAAVRKYQIRKRRQNYRSTPNQP